MGQVGQEAAAPVDRVPGVVGEVVHDSPALAVDCVKDGWGQRQDAGDENEAGLKGFNPREQMALEAPPLPAAAVGQAKKNLPPQAGHAGREVGNGGGVGHSQFPVGQASGGGTGQEFAAQGLRSGGVGQQQQARAHRFAAHHGWMASVRSAF